MGRKKELKICIGLSLAGPVSAENQKVIEPFLAAFAQTPLAWVMPCQPMLESRSARLESLIGAIRDRQDAVGDRIIAAGYSGAPHPLLTVAEIAKELSWSVENPWKSGISDVFRKKPEVFVPVVADFSREKTLSLYNEAGFRLIGLPFPTDGRRYSFFGPRLGKNASLFHYFPLSLLAGVKTSRLIGSLFPREMDELFILVRPAEPESLPLLLAFIEALGKKRGGRVVNPDELGVSPRIEDDSPAFAPGAPVDDANHIIEAGDRPLARLLREKAARLRARDSLKNNDWRDILVLTAGGPEETEKARRGLAPRTTPREGTAYTANMPGEILLPGNGFDAFFSAGRLIDLRLNAQSFLPARPPRAYVLIRGKERSLVFDRIFSFEKDDLRGLESFVLFPGRQREHFFTLRYAFAGDLPWLIISGECRRRIADDRHGIEALSPLEIPLGEYQAGERLLIHAHYPDGTTAQTELSGAEGRIRIPGTVFSLPCHGKHLVFGFVAHKSSPIHLLSVRTVPEKKKWTLWLNPFGAYGRGPVDAGLATGEIRTFYISVREEVPVSPPHFPAATLKIIPAHQVFSPD